ncbi:flavodoxin [Acidovorax soli]|uniref:Flavodoxin n=1 Tax=Acidovorax soli TaxID=592050 RepID=A0A7X0P9D7_9BURK|nr:flavodoxin [Acidovorax soli]MBB6557479.1 flavodoxin [Acidovorax soli]
MNPVHDPARRAAMAAFATLSLADSSAAPGQKPATTGQGEGRPLVAYFSRSGNTRVVAGLIQRAQGADLFEIRPAVPYPEDYLETVEQARKERDSAFEPALESVVKNMAAYDTIYLGFPIWGETAPPLIRSFLAAHDLSGKNLIPFITHGGYGLGSSQSVLAKFAPRALLRSGFVMEAEQERRTMNRVTDWLKEKKVRS